MATPAVVSLSVIRSTVVPSRSRLLETLSAAKSVKEAAAVLEMHTERIARYVRDSDDQEIRKAYRACVERGKRKRAVPKWIVMWDDPRTPGKPVQIWTVHAETRELALEHAYSATGRAEKSLSVTEDK